MRLAVRAHAAMRYALSEASVLDASTARLLCVLPVCGPPAAVVVPVNDRAVMPVVHVTPADEAAVQRWLGAGAVSVAPHAPTPVYNAHALGTDADVELLGVYAAPLRAELSLTPAPATLAYSVEGVRVTLHELRKFLFQLARGNPSMQQALECTGNAYALTTPPFELIYRHARPMLRCRRRVHLTLRHVSGQLTPRRVPSVAEARPMHWWRLSQLLLPVAHVLGVASPGVPSTEADVRALLESLEDVENSTEYAQADEPNDVDVNVFDRILLSLRREQLAELPDDFRISPDTGPVL